MRSNALLTHYTLHTTPFTPEPAYRGLDAASMSESERAFAQDYLRILWYFFFFFINLKPLKI